MLQELCIFPEVPELKDDGARSTPPPLSHFILSIRPCFPDCCASQPSGRKRMSLPVLSSSFIWSLGRAQPLGAMSTFTRTVAQLVGLEARVASAYTWLSRRGYASSGEPGRCEKRDRAMPRLPIPEPLGVPTLFCGHILLPWVWQSYHWGGIHLAPHPKSGAGSLHRVPPSLVILEEESISDSSLASSLGVQTPSPNNAYPSKTNLPSTTRRWWKDSSGLCQTFSDYPQPCEGRCLPWAPSAL